MINLKTIRKRKGLTQQQLADKLKVNKSILANYEAGRHEPNFWRILDISIILDVTIFELMGVEEEIECPDCDSGYYEVNEGDEAITCKCVECKGSGYITKTNQ